MNSLSLTLVALLATAAPAAYAQTVDFDAYAAHQMEVDREQAERNGGKCSITLAEHPNEAGFLVPCKAGDKLTLLYAGKFPQTAREFVKEMCAARPGGRLDKAHDEFRCTVKAQPNRFTTSSDQRSAKPPAQLCSITVGPGEYDMSGPERGCNDGDIQVMHGAVTYPAAARHQAALFCDPNKPISLDRDADTLTCTLTGLGL